MPYVNLPGSVSLWYELHPPSDANTSKPSLLLLAPTFMDSTFLDPYVEQFKDDYSICTLELRSCGRSRNPVTADYDFTVSAADIALTMEALHLPPSHIFGAGCECFQAALKLALLFPEHVLSLSLAGSPTLFAVPTNVAAFEEIDEAWAWPSDTDYWVEAMGGIGEFVLGQKTYPNWPEIWDRVLPSFVRRLNPYRARHIWIHSEPNHRHPRLTPDLLATIKQPVLIIHGDNDTCYAVNEVQEQTKFFRGAKEVRCHIIQDGPHLLAISHAPAVIAHMQAFLSRNIADKPGFLPFDMHRALNTAASMLGNPKIALRNPRNPNSFSLVTPEELVAGQTRLDLMLRQEVECDVPLPMVHEKNDWEEGADQQRRWTWSTREEYSQRFVPRPSSTLSLKNGIAVDVEELESSAARSPLNGLLTVDENGDLPPPVPSKVTVGRKDSA
ncbi:hypothetical protein JCM10207_008134 [Rhodosporidiobolus poonsookiae]